MVARSALAQLSRSGALLAVAAAVTLHGAGCSVQESQLLTPSAGGAGAGGGAGTGAAAGGPSLDAATIRIIDERPVGGASLLGGTTGGGSYAEALVRGAVYVVDDIGELRQRVGGDAPAVVLLAEGTYAFSAAARAVRVCNRSCNVGSILASETIIEANCINGETVFDANLTFDTLRIGSNKTLIGLGRGATLRNAELELSGSSNVILRNLSIQDVAPDISGKGDGINIWPGDHIWIDHVTLRNIGHAYVPIHSSWDEENNQALSVEAGYVTLTHNLFDGYVAGVCNQKSPYVLGTSRNPALTLAYNWFQGASARNGYLFGPGTWAHAFNNYWSDIDRAGLSVACGAAALVQGNFFENTTSALYNEDDGVSSWKFCQVGLFGALYAPLAGGGDEQNLVDENSSMNLHDQPTDGVGLSLPVRQSGHRFRVMVPGTLGRSTESYEVTLEADPQSVAALVRATAGSGRLF